MKLTEHAALDVVLGHPDQTVRSGWVPERSALQRCLERWIDIAKVKGGSEDITSRGSSMCECMGKSKSMKEFVKRLTTPIIGRKGMRVGALTENEAWAVFSTKESELYPASCVIPSSIWNWAMMRLDLNLEESLWQRRDTLEASGLVRTSLTLLFAWIVGLKVIPNSQQHTRTISSKGRVGFLWSSRHHITDPSVSQHKALFYVFTFSNNMFRDLESY